MEISGIQARTTKDARLRIEKLTSVIGKFNFELLDDPEFGEDSVREELVVPIIKALGYSADGRFKIVRSRKLLHPFVSIGSQRKPINVIPDYVFEIDGKPCWILDAKAPGESIVKSVHVEQAYSYAMHSEIRSVYFALCNGREFALYHVSEDEPILKFPLIALPVYWDNLKSLLSPETILTKNHRELNKDFGLHIKRVGFTPEIRLTFLEIPVPYIAKFNDNHFTFANNVIFDGYTYCASYDFDHDVFTQLHGKLPEKALEMVDRPNNGAINNVEFANARYFISVDCVLGEKLEENDLEIFMPLRIVKIR